MLAPWCAQSYVHHAVDGETAGYPGGVSGPAAVALSTPRRFSVRRQKEVVTLFRFVFVVPCNYCSNWKWVVEEILAYVNRLRSTHYIVPFFETKQTHAKLDFSMVWSGFFISNLPLIKVGKTFVSCKYQSEKNFE